MAIFINSSNRTTAPLIRERDKLQAEIERVKNAADGDMEGN
jgi:hypothetical protein